MQQYHFPYICWWSVQHVSSQKRTLHQGQRGQGREEEARGGREGTELAGGVAVVSQMLAESELASRVLDSVLCRLCEIYYRQLCNVCACMREREKRLTGGSQEEQTYPFWRESGQLVRKTLVEPAVLAASTTSIVPAARGRMKEWGHTSSDSCRQFWTFSAACPVSGRKW